MTGSIVDLFPPELQTVYGAAAGALLVTGLFFWGAGIRIARSSLAIWTGLAVAGAAAWGLPGLTGVSVLTAAIIGFVVGLLSGAVAFRVVQGAVVAICLALAVSGGYYRWQVTGGGPGPTAGTAPAATLSAKEMLIPPERLAVGPAAATTMPARADVATIEAAVQRTAIGVKDSAMRVWSGIPAVHQRRMIGFSIFAAIVGLILALIFPRYTTWIMTAALGTALLVLPGYALIQVYAPQYEIYVPAAAKGRWPAVAVVMLLGMLLQRGLFWPGKKKQKPKAESAPKWAPD